MNTFCLNTFTKKNLQFGQRVRIVKTGSVIDGVEGTVTGISSIFWYNTYIITLDTPMELDVEVMPKFQTITMNEMNLEII